MESADIQCILTCPIKSTICGLYIGRLAKVPDPFYRYKAHVLFVVTTSYTLDSALPKRGHRCFIQRNHIGSGASKTSRVVQCRLHLLLILTNLFALYCVYVIRCKQGHDEGMCYMYLNTLKCRKSRDSVACILVALTIFYRRPFALVTKVVCCRDVAHQS